MAPPFLVYDPLKFCEVYVARISLIIITGLGEENYTGAVERK